MTEDRDITCEGCYAPEPDGKDWLETVKRGAIAATIIACIALAAIGLRVVLLNWG